jgi:hypothetical protein
MVAKVLTFSEMKGDGAMEAMGLDHQVVCNIFSYSDEEHRRREGCGFKQQV